MSRRPLAPAVSRWAFPVAIFLAFALSVPVSLAGSYRSLDGSGNNLANPTWGAAHEQLLRLAPDAYEDGLSVPRGGDPTSLPSARAISNAVAAQSGLTPNAAGASDWLWQWGQFIDHDLDLTSGGGADFNIAVPTGDPFFDPFNAGTQTIGLTRAVFDPATGTTNARQQVNEITAYIDASMVYGSDATRAADLREAGGNGRLRTSAGNLLPFNTNGLPNDNGGSTDNAAFFIAGDLRANEQIGLTATHTLFVREHNRLVGELETRLSNGDATLIAKRDAAIADVGNGVTSEADFLYESARKVVGAQIQKITYEEFLPTLLGSTLTAYSGYDDTVNAGIANEFSGAAFRVGHTMLSPNLQLVNDSGSSAGEIALQDSFFTPSTVQALGVDTILGGLGTQDAQEVDNLVVDDVRNFLFGPPGSGGFDLASLNIQRGRDHGLGSLNETRDSLGLSTYDTFLEMTGGDVDLANAFASVYTSVDDIDLWSGGLAEAQVNDGLLGETFYEIIADQFLRTRDGDRFFYENDLDHLLVIDPAFNDTLLSDLLLRNTGLTAVQANVFATIPEPSGALLVALGCFAVGSMRWSADRATRS